MKQHALTVLAPIQPTRVAALRALLTEIGEHVADSEHLRLAASRSTHFARFVVLDSDGQTGPRLLFTSNHDGDLASYARELAQTLGPGLDRIFEHCAGYPPGAARDPQRLRAFLAAHGRPSDVFYVACRATAREILEAGRIRAGFDDLLDHVPAGPAGRFAGLFQAADAPPPAPASPAQE
nr:hypothetical protein [Solirubrobacterales bacterium]